MKTLTIVLLLAFSFMAAQAEPYQTRMSIFMKSIDEEPKSMDVPFISFDNMGFETLKSDALAPTTPEPETTSLPTTEAATAKRANKDKSKKKKRFGRKNRSSIL